MGRKQGVGLGDVISVPPWDLWPQFLSLPGYWGPAGNSVQGSPKKNGSGQSGRLLLEVAMWCIQRKRNCVNSLGA